MEIKKINQKEQNVTIDETTITHKEFMEKFTGFWDNKIKGKTIVPIFYEYIFGKGGSNALNLLMKGMKHEGYLMGSMDKLLTKGQKIALVTVVVIVFVAIFILYALRGMGILNFG